MIHFVVFRVGIRFREEGSQTQVLGADVLTDERFEGVQSGGGAGIGFADDGDDGRYSGETGEDVRVQGVETVGEGVVVVRRGRVDHVKSAMNVSIKVFLRALHFCFLLLVQSSDMG